MRTNRLGSLRILICISTLLVLDASSAHAQGIVSAEKLDDWFVSRLAWGAVAGLIIGVVIGLVHLCRLKYQITALQLNSAARKKFIMWGIILLVVCAILLFVDAWLLYPFSKTANLGFWETLTRVWFNYRTLTILVVTFGTFTLAVALATRLKADCRCRYAFLPGPRGK